MTVAWVLGSTDHGPMIINRLDYNEGFNGQYYGVGAQLMENGNYDPREVALLKELLDLKRKYVGDGVFALDCGANIGVHSLEWAKLMRGWGSVLAIEAQERVFYALAGNLALHNAHNARAIWAALDSECGEMTIPEPDYTQAASFGSFELRNRLGVENIGQPINYDKPSLKVRTVTIDSLKLPRVDLIKMDIEGMELEAVSGAIETLKRCKPILNVECVKVDKTQLETILKELGYVFFPMGMNMLAVHKDDRVKNDLQVVKVAA